MLKHRHALIVVLAAILAIAITACGGDGSDETSTPHERDDVKFSEPVGSLSADASPGDNTASSVGPIGATGEVTDSACSDGDPEIVLDLVIGDEDGDGGIPDGKDIMGWQARIQFDPAVLAFAGFQMSDDANEPQFFMEKASDHTSAADEHLRLVNPQPAPDIGTFDIGSAIVGSRPGASGVGLIASLLFDCVGSGGTCVDIADADNSFYVDPDSANRQFEQRHGVSLSVNGGNAPADCPPPGQ